MGFSETILATIDIKDQWIKELEKATTEREDALADLLNIEAMSTDQLQSLCFRVEEELASRGIFT